MQQAWDKNGRIYYIDDNGNRVQPKSTLNAFQKLGNDFKALKTNVKNAIDNLGVERSHTYFAPFNELKNAYESGFIGKRELPYLAQGRADQEIREANKQQKASQVKNYVGSAISATSAHPLLNIPYVGTGLGGAVYELGQGIASGDSVGDIIDRTGQGFIVGETVGAIPYVGRGLGKTKLGQAVSNKATQGLSKLAETPLGQKVGNWASKAEDVLMSDIAQFNPNKQTGYHGSLVDFNKFSNEAIGTGEGAQAHGYGHYAALDKNVADTRYRHRLLQEKLDADIGTKIKVGDKTYTKVAFNTFADETGKRADDAINGALNKIHNANGNKENALNSIQRMLDEAKENGDLSSAVGYSDIKNTLLNNNFNISQKPGQLYKLSIPKDDVMLRERLPFKEQPLKVQNSLKDIINNAQQKKINDQKEMVDFLEKEARELENAGIDYSNIAKKQLEREKIKLNDIIKNTKKTSDLSYTEIEQILGHNKKEVRDILQQHGIKGISYNGGIDGEARVIFNPDDIQIVRKYYNQPSLGEMLLKKSPNVGATSNYLYDLRR